MRDSVSLVRYRITSRAALICASGMNEPRSSPHLQKMHQPFGIGQVRFAARHVTHMAGVADQDLLELAVLNQRVIHRHRIDPGRFHRHMRDLLLGQPPCSVLEHPVERLKRLFDRLPMLGTVTGKPHRHRDDVFSDIDCRATLIQNQHGVAFLPGVPS